MIEPHGNELIERQVGFERRVEQFVCLGINSDRQPVLFIGELHHGLVHRLGSIL